ncbi:MAG: peptidylprolyl isomerase [Candidatus Glassbacteria bacterium]|nr:peptidylprolyl isomerase [Candidatus Glassbacteria bacterium]
MSKRKNYILPLFFCLILYAAGCSKKEENPYLENVQFEQLLVKPVPAEEEFVKAEATARKVLEELRGGADFAEAAKNYSVHPSAGRGGEINLTRGWMDPAFDEAVFAMKDSTLSDIIRTPEALYLVYRISSEYLQVRSSHILFKAGDEKLSEEWHGDEEAAEHNAMEIYRRLKKDESFYELAKEYSDDPGSAQNGGDLGWTKRNTLDRDYEAVAFSQEPGEISKPVKTRFGYHIIRTVKKKDHNLKLRLIQFEVPVGRKERLRAHKALEEARRQAEAGVELKLLGERLAGSPEGVFSYNEPYAVRKSMLVPELAEQVEKMDGGDVSGIVESGMNYYFIRLTEN